MTPKNAKNSPLDGPRSIHATSPSLTTSPRRENVKALCKNEIRPITSAIVISGAQDNARAEALRMIDASSGDWRIGISSVVR